LNRLTRRVANFSKFRVNWPIFRDQFMHIGHFSNEFKEFNDSPVLDACQSCSTNGRETVVSMHRRATGQIPCKLMEWD
jgi:hypothetical protein